jgi:hypothetical protein
MATVDLGYAAHPNDPTSASKPDCVTVVCDGEHAYVYGGWAADRVWRLNVPSASWTEVVTHGAVPHPRIHHSAVVYNGFMLVTGGELVDVRAGTTPAQLISYYELDLSTMEWLAVETFGAIPANRTNHTTCVVNDTVVLFGGKPADGRMLTTVAMAEAKRTGFFDVYILHVLSRTWRRVEMYDPRAPMLWGHSACVFRNSFILCFGGFDVGTAETAAASPFAHHNELIETAPEAVLSDVVHILDFHALVWKRCSPPEDPQHIGSPIPRAMHFACTIGADMYVFGGFSIDRSGRGVNTNDFWKWDIADGTWSRVEFCLPTFASRRLIAAAYGDHLLVVPRMTHLFFLNTARRGSGWQKVPCTVESRPLVNAFSTSLAAEQPAPGAHSPLSRAPDARLRAASATHPGGFRQLRTPSPTAAGRSGRTTSALQPAVIPITSPQREYDAEVEMLKREVEVLRAQVRDKEIAETRPPQQAVAKPRARVSQGGPVARILDNHSIATSTGQRDATGVKSGMHKWIQSTGAVSPSTPTRSGSKTAASPKSRGGVRSPVSPAFQIPTERVPLPARAAFREEQEAAGEDVVEERSAWLHERPAAAAEPAFKLGPNATSSPDARMQTVSASPVRMHASLAGTRLLHKQREHLNRDRQEQLHKLQRRLAELYDDTGANETDRALVESLVQEAARVESTLQREASRSSSPMDLAAGSVPSARTSAASARKGADAAPATLMQRARNTIRRPEECTAVTIKTTTWHSPENSPPRAVRIDVASTPPEPTPPAPPLPPPVSAHREPAAASTRLGFVVGRAPSTVLSQEVAIAQVYDPTHSVESRSATPVSEYWDELERALDAPPPQRRQTRLARPRPEWQS